jgi:hypothetical protein
MNKQQCSDILGPSVPSQGRVLNFFTIAQVSTFKQTLSPPLLLVAIATL